MAKESRLTLDFDALVVHFGVGVQIVTREALVGSLIEARLTVISTFLTVISHQTGLPTSSIAVIFMEVKLRLRILVAHLSTAQSQLVPVVAQ